MVTRKALIIGSPDKYIPGVNVDIKNINSFLLSAIGGAWKESELINLTNPTIEEVRNKISLLKQFDYSFVFFAGHGYYSMGKDSTILNLNATQELDSIELREGASKHTLILDCCRILKDDRILKEAALGSLIFDSANQQKPTASECRTYFNKKIEECNPGLVVMNSCNLNESAEESASRGGYYTSSLIKSSQDWANQKLLSIDLSKKYEIYSTQQCHNEASIRVKKLSGNRQNPVFEGPRSENKFPFAVVA
ncbi:hypothetical protein F9230_07620 [Acinetobacter johnsonii]|uniref:caspase family protein n=1 Tax=Acinetobacter johnsonii TaxID=40214 RepID=UPI001F463034|nr:caspase family protein [Acinetobacter johnsonii]UJA04225.1 hypothetical protein F9230_07620 [Acinetobacter johnsonii]